MVHMFVSSYACLTSVQVIIDNDKHMQSCSYTNIYKYNRTMHPRHISVVLGESVSTGTFTSSKL